MATFEYDNPATPFPTRIETDRLVFVPLSADVVSVNELYELYKDLPPQATKHVTFDAYDTVNEAKEFLDGVQEPFENGEDASYAILKDGEFIGTAGYNPNWERRIAESGVFLLPEHWGNGYGTERGEAMVELAFEEHELEAWLSRCTIDNDASARSIEKYVVENGGECVGILPNCPLNNGGLSDVYVYKLHREDYFANESKG